MSETQGTSESTQPVETVTDKPGSANPIETAQTKVKTFLNSWQLKVGIVGAIVMSIALTAFFWQHAVAGFGMKLWSQQAGATPIECMVKDTNADQYVSCSAILNDQVVPLECGASIFNIGCRINYGSAARGALQTQSSR